MKRFKGFTLIELLIVVAIIAILAAIAVPNFLEAQVRSKVSRVKSDQRSMATAIESYYVDNNQYPAMTTVLANSVDEGIITTSAGVTFARRLPTTQLSTLTTPIAYITSYFADPFADTRGLTFRYYKERAGWILGSWGPDTDQGTINDVAWDSVTASPYGFAQAAGSLETVYDAGVAQPSTTLLTGTSADGGAYTYDPTNGTVSQGDVWRVKQ